MRLEKTIFDGFKSFADKTEFAFDSPITAIVGPNGCGKSNIVDGVKWVLGEQSVKSLRSDQMADVIFGGSGSRKPLGSAEVVLIISNPDGNIRSRLPIDADQVQISRRIYRSGESEYRINNKLCRLKDIRELFMDTGVSTKAYSIIEQGQIEQLVSASKTDRRTVFEEAAGISKYKAHKKEALRKLERTEQNLLRLADILQEVAKQLRSVKLQAGKARNYLQYSQRLKELQVNYSLVEYDKFYSQFKDKQAVLERAEKQFAQMSAELAKADATMSRLGNEIIEKEHELSDKSNCLVAVQSKIEQQLQRIEFLKSKIKELQERRESQRQKIEELQQQQDIIKTDLAKHKSELTSCERIINDKNKAIEQLHDVLRQLEIECSSLEANLEDEKSGIIDIVRRTAQLHNEISSISDYRSNLSNQKDRLTNRAETTRAELERLLAGKAQYSARLKDIENVIGELQQSLESKRNEAEQIDKLIETDSKRMARSKEARSALSGEFAVLTDMERRCEGLATAVKAILQSRSDADGRLGYVEGILAEIITTDVEHANAVEAALEGRTDSVVVSSTAELLADKQTIEKLDGRISFLPLDKVEPFKDSQDSSNLPGVKGRIIEFVRYDDRYAPLAWDLLGKTLLVDSLNTALKLTGSLAKGYTFVTVKGESVRVDGSLSLGPLGKTTGLISRKSRMSQLEQTIAGITSEIEAIEKHIEENSRTRAHLEKVIKDLRTAVYEANTEKMQTSSKLALYEQSIDKLKQEEPLIVSEIEQLQSQIAQSAQKEYESKQKLDELELINKQRSLHIEELEAKNAELKKKQQSDGAQLTDLKVALGQAVEQSKALRQIIMNLQSQTQGNLKAVAAAEEERQDCGEQLTNAQSDILASESTVSGLFVDKDKHQQMNQSLRTEITGLLEQQKNAEQLLHTKGAEKNEIQQRINQLKIELGQLEVKQQDLIEKVQEELQIDLTQAYTNYEDSEVDWEGIREEISELRGKIERLGNVNIDAIEEQQSLEERHSFLSNQVEDLNRSKAQLQQLINRLNKKSREKFLETFEQIRGHFQEIFRKLFGGGKADIVLEDAEDVLEAGIEVIARPPGKETRSISLLSGGEKSMTALALLFAVFRTKPSPFCFLDEVDAALDEANNERFNLLLQEFQKDTQFIIITHAKRTMSIADVLLGITMQTQGVSQKISVRFDEYEEEPAAA